MTRFDDAVATITRVEQAINHRTNDGKMIDGAAIVALALVAVAKALLVTDMAKEI